MTDAELLEAYRATHDRQILDGLFARHYPTVYHVVLKLVRNGTDAGDLTQSTFLKAMESAESVRSSGSLRNWLLTIAINEVRQFRRAAVRRNRPEAVQAIARRESAEPPRDADLLRREFEEQLEQALQQFPDELKDPLVLHYYQNLSYAETAQILGIPKSTVQFRMDQALRELRARIRKPELLALLPELFAQGRLGKKIGWGLAIMNAKTMAAALVMLCTLCAGGSLIWRSARRSLPARSAETAASTAASPARAAAPGKAGPIAEPAGAGIFGKVLDRDTGAPIAGATISVFDFETGATDRTLSDETGAFRLASAQGSARIYHLKTSGRGYAPASTASVAASTEPLVLKLARGGTLLGRVVNADGGAVFPYRISAVRGVRDADGDFDLGAVLYRQALPHDWVPEEAETTVHPDGRFEIRHLSPGVYGLVVSSPDFFPCLWPEKYGSQDNPLIVQEGATREVRIELPPRGLVRVRAVDLETREPIAGAEVSMIAWMERQHLILDRPRLTDVNGFCDVPASLYPTADRLASTELRVSKEGYGSRLFSFAGQENGFVCEAELSKPATVHGRVRTPGGEPIARAAVYFERSVDGDLAAKAFTDEDGRYVANGIAAPDEYNVYVYDRRLTTSRSAARIGLRAGESREVNFGTASGGVLSGRITFRGQACAGSSVCVDGPGERERLICRANAQGEYRVESLAPGTYTLDASFGGRDRTLSLERQVTLGDGERRQEDFQAGGRVIRGTAVDAATLQPIAEKGIDIIAHRIDEADPAGDLTTRTRENGTFELDLPRPGLYELRTDNRTGQDFYASNLPQIDLRTNDSVEDVSLLLFRDPRDGTITFRLTDAATGEPVQAGWYHYSVGHCGGAGSFDGPTVEEFKVRIGSYEYRIGTDEHVPVRLTFDITTTQRQVERTVALVRSEAVRVLKVHPSSPAERAGLRDGDLLISYDGAPIPNLSALRALSSKVQDTQKVTVEVRRGAESLVVVIPGQRLGIDAENARK